MQRKANKKLQNWWVNYSVACFFLNCHLVLRHTKMDALVGYIISFGNFLDIPLGGQFVIEEGW